VASLLLLLLLVAFAAGKLLLLSAGGRGVGDLVGKSTVRVNLLFLCALPGAARDA